VGLACSVREAAKLYGLDGGLGAVRYLEFLYDMLDVPLDRGEIDRSFGASHTASRV
jgi:hypothetical protein